MPDHLNYPDAGPAGNAGPQRLRVLLIDDYPAVLEALAEVLEVDNTLTVVGTASRVSEAIRLAQTSQPDVAVLDVNMPEGGGWAAARNLRSVCPDIRLVAYTAFDEALVRRTLAAAGVSAVVPKGPDSDLLLMAIHGENVMPSPRETVPMSLAQLAGSHWF